MEVKQYATKQWIGQPENHRKLKEYKVKIEIENTMVQNILEATEAVLREQYIAIQAYLKKNFK